MLFLRRVYTHVLNIPGNSSVRCMSHSVPILNEEVLRYLTAENQQTILDMTFGSGLHTESILKANVGTRVLALDRDPNAFSKANRLAEKFPDRVFPLLGCFSDLPKLLGELNMEDNSLDGVLLDVGCSDLQLEEENRGFNPNINGVLDMRMDCDRVPNSITAADVLALCGEQDLQKIFKVYGKVDLSRKLARALITSRYHFTSLKTTFELKDFISEMFYAKVAVKDVFYALRTFVNNEVNELNFALALARKYLKKGGNLVTITYNPLEDLIVKRHITGLVFENNPAPLNLKYYSRTFNLSADEIESWRKSSWTSLTKHVIASKGSVSCNQSAKLRAAVKVK